MGFTYLGQEQGSFARAVFGVAGAVFALQAGCLEHPLKAVQVEDAQVLEETLSLSVNKDVDILFVLDNSGSMGEEQATLARNFEAFIRVLEEEGVEANYRIGITTTDNGGGPGCVGADAGQLKFSSCRERLQGFISLDGQTNRQQEACLDICEHETLRTLPSAARGGGALVARPWIERSGDTTNLPATDEKGREVTTVSAFQCLAPQGIRGCGFEQHLESMHKTLLRSDTPKDPAYQFIRPSALLAVVILTDEVDCSVSPEGASIFTDPRRTFWSDRSLPQATSAVCWNAGVACVEGSPGFYETCTPENYDVHGASGVSPDRAVLHPIARYIEQLQGIEDEKKKSNPAAEVLVSLIAGVPEEYDTRGAELIYQPGAPGPGGSLAEFGVGFGCETDDGRAVPPVRELAVAKAFNTPNTTTGNVFSICRSSYRAALEKIASVLRDQLKPACLETCAADSDASTPGIQPDCHLVEEIPMEGDIVARDLVSCIVSGDAPEIPPGQDACYVTRTDDGGRDPTSVAWDDLDKTCIAAGWNVEFKILRRTEPPGGTAVRATCKLSQNPSEDCPNRDAS